ncbi:MAG TPA: PIN domain-containing protein [Chthonomonadaceae bacterium]|nr:PIN domain-containing protein [Chthonomonadaceae bacterium]
MADYLIDTNVLLRRIDLNSPQRPIARRALRILRAQGHTLCITPQNVIEFWNVATRPTTARGGLGLDTTLADRKVQPLERIFTLLSDLPTIYSEWRRIVVAHAVQGVQVHDARLVAAMTVHGVSHILTFNADDFACYPGIAAVNPHDV